MMKGKINIADCNKGDWRVTGYDGSYPGCSSSFILIDGVTKAIAKSIERHNNRNILRQEILCGCSIDIGFTAENPYDRDMGDMYGGRSLLMGS